MKLEKLVGGCFAKKFSYHTGHILTLKVFLVFFCESKVFWCFERFFRLVYQASIERMIEQHLGIDYNVNSLNFGQRKSSLYIEYNLAEKMDLTAIKSNSIVGSFIDNSVFDNGKSIQHMTKDILSKETLHHNQLDLTNKCDLELDQTVQSWPIQFDQVCCIILFTVIDCNNVLFENFQEYPKGDVAIYNYENAPNYYFINAFKILTIIMIIHLKFIKLVILDWN